MVASAMAVNNATQQETFMEMLEFQPGMGLGASKFRVVFVFETPDAFNSFVNSGWEAGTDAMAAAKSKTQGGALMCFPSATVALLLSSGFNTAAVVTLGRLAGAALFALGSERAQQ